MLKPTGLLMIQRNYFRLNGLVLGVRCLWRLAALVVVLGQQFGRARAVVVRDDELALVRAWLVLRELADAPADVEQVHNEHAVDVRRQAPGLSDDLEAEGH